MGMPFRNVTVLQTEMGMPFRNVTVLQTEIKSMMK